MKAPIFNFSSGRSEPIVTPCPERGVNLWLMSAARRCQIAGYNEDEARQFLHDNANLREGRTLGDREIDRAIAKAYGTACEYGGQRQIYRPWTPAKITEKAGPILTRDEAVEFFDSSPVPSPADLSSSDVLASLFDPGDVLALKPKAQAQALRCPVVELPDLFRRHAACSMQLVTSSPITGKAGLTQEGKPSFIAKSCFPAQRHVVVEFDGLSPCDQLRRLIYLRRQADRKQAATLAMILHSGSDSLHAWFRPSAGWAEDFKVAAIKLGADPAAMLVSQLVRCPNQTRDNGRRQGVLWLNDPAVRVLAPLTHCQSC